MRSQLLTSAKVKLFINGRPFGRVSSFSWSAETARHPAYGIDSTSPYELMPTTTRCTGQITVYRASRDGGAEGAGMVAPSDLLSQEKYFSLLMVDQTTDAVLFQADACSLQSQSWSVPERGGYVVGSISFEALSWNNEIQRNNR